MDLQTGLGVISVGIISISAYSKLPLSHKHTLARQIIPVWEETGVGFLVAAGVHKLFILVPDLAMHRIGGMSTCWETKKDKKANKETAFIKNGSKLLEKLVDICDGKCNSLRMDMANAVAFLHVAFAKPIVFRNIKPLNILLDDNHGAKLSDFSISISIPKGESHVRDSVAGATGLIAPEYLTTGNFNEKQDVFNFGVFLLVLLSGQMVVDFSRPEKEILLQDHVKKCIEDDRFNKVIDSTIIAEGTWPGKEQQLQAYTALSLRCISELAEDRPTMVDVSQELRKIYWSAISCRSTFDPFYAVFEATPSGATVKCKRLIQKKITEQQVKNSKN
ncbi:non-functional pseudokinase ZED1-like [Populus alba x Populus x berolinensis]|nr:non-functional pseudokinase ZED1-like [Populus alba x Populus x berolinensis]